MYKNFNFKNGLNYSIKSIDKLLKSKNNIIINISGSTGSGKTTFVNKLKENYKDKLLIISMDDYYKGKKFIDNEIKAGRDCSFDHIEAIDTKLIIENLQSIQKGQTIKKPIYCMKIQAPKGEEEIKLKKIVIIEGIYALHNSLSIINFDLSIFLDAPSDVRLERRLKRDSKRTNDSKKTTINFFNIAEIMYQKEVVKNMKNAHIIVNN